MSIIQVKCFQTPCQTHYYKLTSTSWIKNWPSYVHACAYTKISNVHQIVFFFTRANVHVIVFFFFAGLMYMKLTVRGFSSFPSRIIRELDKGLTENAKQP
jgi:hypothetical protein